LSEYPITGPSGKGILIEDIHLEKDELESEDIVILFREAKRLHCLFGFRMCAHESVGPDQLWSENDAPVGYGTVIYGNLMEHIQAAKMGLPEDCDTDNITWI